MSPLSKGSQTHFISDEVPHDLEDIRDDADILSNLLQSEMEANRRSNSSPICVSNFHCWKGHSSSASLPGQLPFFSVASLSLCGTYLPLPTILLDRMSPAPLSVSWVPPLPSSWGSALSLHCIFSVFSCINSLSGYAPPCHSLSSPPPSS